MEKLGWEKTGKSTVESKSFFGNNVTADVELMLCSEAIFKPSLVGEDGPGLPERIIEVVNTINKNTELSGVANLLRSNIIVCGGGSLQKGFVGRLEKELKQLDPSVTVVHPQDPQNLAWRGGSQMILDGKIKWVNYNNK